jgi:hypothetical protein
MAWAAASVSRAQLATSPIAFANLDAITVSFVAPPDLGGTGTGSTDADATQWLKVEFHYGTTPNLKTNFLDEVEFRVWIEGLDLLATDAPVKGEGVAVGLTGTVTYINVPANKDIYGSFYVHPSTLSRYTSTRGTSDFEKKFDVHIEAYVGGVLMDAIDKNKGEVAGWHLKLRPIPNLVYRQNQCPFMISDSSRYPAIKMMSSSGQ